MKGTWLLTLVAVLIVVATPFALMLYYGQAEDVAENTLDYWLGVPSSVKSVPIVSPCQQPRFSGLGREGNIPAHGIVRYGTEASPEHASAVIANAFAAEGCTATPEGPLGSGLICPSGDTVLIEAELGPDCNPVQVSVFEGQGG